MTTFGDRLYQRVQDLGPLCVGIDPHAGLLDAWGLPDSAAGAYEFSMRTIEAATDRVAIMKPQSAFYERHGSAGVAVLEKVLRELKARDILSILDAKRGDIGSTMDAYVQASLLSGSPLEADALTVSPYLGFAALDSAVNAVREHDKGIFVLALTSNPSGPQVQHARVLPEIAAQFLSAEIGGNSQNADIIKRQLKNSTSGEPKAPEEQKNGCMQEVSVAAVMAAEAVKANKDLVADNWGSVGLVIGATVGDALQKLGLDLGIHGLNTPILAPGFGAQGAGVAERTAVFGKAANQVLVSVSRGVLKAGPNVPNLRQSIDTWQQEYALKHK